MGVLPSCFRRVRFAQIVMLLALCASPFAHSVPEDVVVYWHHPSLFNRHSMAVLHHALDYHGDRYVIRLYEDSRGLDLKRELRNLSDGKVSVIWTATSRALEKEYFPVRVPIFGGLMGYRVLMIPEGEQSAFNEVDTLQDLRKFRIGQGLDWTDTGILKANGLNVVTSPQYYSLFPMLDQRRFDAFPRGFSEAWDELRRYNQLNLAIEERILIQYKMPIYFFVNRDNPELAEALYTGMMRAVQDGSLHRKVLSQPEIVESAKGLKLSKRRIVELANPFLTEETPLAQKALWLDVNALGKL